MIAFKRILNIATLDRPTYYSEKKNLKHKDVQNCFLIYYHSTSTKIRYNVVELKHVLLKDYKYLIDGKDK